MIIQLVLIIQNCPFQKWFTLPSVMGPRIDGDFIPDDPYKMVVTMACPAWELMSGFTAQDGGLLTLR